VAGGNSDWPQGGGRGEGTQPLDLNALRAEIDALDREIQRVITRRATVALEVARAKREAGVDEDFYRPEREAAILRRVVDRNLGPLTDETLVRLYREIISACLALQNPLRVAFLGPAGTFTQAAVLKHFGQSV